MTEDSSSTASPGRMNRAQFLQRAAALGLLATAGSAITGSPLPAAAASETPVRRGLRFKGVAYDTARGSSATTAGFGGATTSCAGRSGRSATGCTPTGWASSAAT